MCVFSTPSIPKDNSAELARKREEERKQRITEGEAKIDTQFEQFDDPYFKRVETAHFGNYAPQLEDQYGDARRKITLSLARTGNLNASSGARTLGDLAETYEKNRVRLGEEALGAANSARSRVEAARSDLYSQNRAAADPSAAARSALAQSELLSAPQTFSPLANVFASLINSAATGLAAERAGYRGFNTGLFSNGGASGGSSGSSRVVMS